MIKMQLYCQLIEQLGLAAKQLHLNGVNYSRFALFLADNVVELLLGAHADMLVTVDEIDGWCRPPQYSTDRRKFAREGYFIPTAKYCLLSQLTRDAAYELDGAIQHEIDVYRGK